MNIIINALLLTGKYSGIQHSIENYLYALKELRPDNVKILIPNNYTGILKNDDFKFIKPNINCTNRVQRIMWENFILPLFLRNKNIIYHTPGQILPLYCLATSIITIHDIITAQFPELCQKESVAYYKYMLPLSIYKANKIITVSETIKNDIIEKYKVNENKISVVYHGIRPKFKKISEPEKLVDIALKYNLPDKYILFVGNIEPRKNLINLFKAFSLLKENSDVEHKLVIVGKKAWMFDEIFASVIQLKIQNYVVFLGYVDDEDLPVIYNLADLFVMPSIYEGFGLPVLEAMSCGVPTIISNTGALPEIAGNSAIQVQPNDYQTLSQKMNDLLSNVNMRQEYINRGYLRTTFFSWPKAAENILKIYSNI